MDNADLSQLPRPLREAMLRACESVIDLHDVLQQVSPAQPSAPYPRSAMEWLVLAALAAMAPMPATPKQGAEMIHKPHLEVQKILFALEVLGTMYRLLRATTAPWHPHRCPRTSDGPAHFLRLVLPASWRRRPATQERSATGNSGCTSTTQTRKGRPMIEGLHDQDTLHIDSEPSTTLLNAVDAVTDMVTRVRHAEGMAQVCVSAMDDDELEEPELRHALLLLHDYLTALRNGMWRWRTETLPEHRDLNPGAVDADDEDDE